jgi:hypothetical protein
VSAGSQEVEWVERRAMQGLMEGRIGIVDWRGSRIERLKGRRVWNSRLAAVVVDQRPLSASTVLAAV